MKNAAFSQLRVFNEVARHLSFARASEALCLSPPEVTMHIKELEGHIGLPLYERSGRKISLTTAANTYRQRKRFIKRTGILRCP